ncbi:MAG: hypothetical protein ABSD29_16925 [Verrucomicrobiota bacterium]|jgi:hypothetical protein
MPQYSGDPRWLTARFASKCPCGKTIQRGERTFYYPRTKIALCQQPCGQKASAEFAAAAQDEAFCGGQSC